MIIDAHNHPDWHKHDFEKFIANMDKNGIDKTWLLSWETPYGDFDPSSVNVLPGAVLNGERSVPIPFSRCLEYKRRAPDRFVLGYAPDPHRPDAVLALRSAVDLYGVKVCGEVKFRLMYDDPDCIDLFRAAGDMHLPVTLHFDYDLPNRTGAEMPRRSWWFGGRIENLDNLLSLCPDTAILGHAPGFWAHISGEPDAKDHVYRRDPIVPGGRIEELLAKHKNLYCDISAGSGCVALSRDLDYTYRLICRFPDRFLYARDYFDTQHRELIESLSLPADIKELVYHGNAERLIGEA
jgi:predicted TIM-barrel fold metal-dependent hydrolase